MLLSWFHWNTFVLISWRRFCLNFLETLPSNSFVTLPSNSFGCLHLLQSRRFLFLHSRCLHSLQFRHFRLLHSKCLHLLQSRRLRLLHSRCLHPLQSRHFRLLHSRCLHPLESRHFCLLQSRCLHLLQSRRFRLLFYHNCGAHVACTLSSKTWSNIIPSLLNICKTNENKDLPFTCMSKLYQNKQAKEITRSQKVFCPLWISDNCFQFRAEST